ncbi:hypothetical protein OB69_01505 [Roseivirga seohaensis subsp. aquiponti]|uniref:Thioredoxin domain-containing protein n=1 Tax=Roseivirga seohaensis subsp. aquiponti TaxID=1566026 RepID=A0A0L8APX7_9BACT|nr:thioredoxin-like domain-containing protein [Roseivirga seohaensis]KOF04232.1 hypothetical protein OB69_01505 [Roseivirga seohaensis subsp. aquiponti]
MRILKLLILVLVLGITSKTSAQEIYNADYTFTIEGLAAGENMRLAYYLGDKQYIKQESLSQEGGLVNFKIDTLHVGLCMLVFPDNNYFEFVAKEPRVIMKTNKDDVIGAMEVIASEENAKLYEYLKYNNQRQIDLQKIEDNAQLNDEQKATMRMDMNQKGQVRQKEFVEKYPNSFMAKLISASMDYVPKDAPEGLSDDEINAYRFYEYRKHYFDNIDFSQSDLLYSPVYHPKLMAYTDQLTLQQPDSLIAATEYLLGKASANDEYFKYTLITLLNKFAKTKVICQDEVYLHLVDNYYLSGKAVWMDEEGLTKLKVSADNLRNNLCGKLAVNFELPDVNGTKQSLYAQSAEYTILAFMQTDCIPCEKVLEELSKIDQTILPSFKVVTVFKEGDKAVWKGVLMGKTKPNWVNLMNDDGTLNSERDYNVQSYPTLYLLDKDKRIVLKRISASQIVDYMNTVNN